MKTHWIKVAAITLSFGMVAPSITQADAECVAPVKVTESRWTTLKRALPISDELVEGTYFGKGHTTRTEYELHLIQYLKSTDTFVAVIENRERESGTIGLLRRQAPGTYFWHGIRALSGVGSRLEPVFEGRPLFSLMVNLDRKGRTADIEAVSLNPDAGVEVIRFTEAKAPMLRRTPILTKYKVRTGWRAHDYVIVAQNEQDTAETSEESCPEDGVPSAFQRVSSWRVREMSVSEDKNWSGDYLGRMELPGVLALRSAVYDEVVPRPEARVSAAMVSLHRRRVFRDRDEVLFFKVDENGFLSGDLAHLKNEF